MTAPCAASPLAKAARIRSTSARAEFRAQLDRDAVAAAFTLIGEVDPKHMVERGMIGMIEIDVRGVDPHPALAAFGAADERCLFDDIGAHVDLPLYSAAMLAAEVAR